MRELGLILSPVYKVGNLTQRAPADLSQTQAEAESFSPEDTQDAPKDRKMTPGPTNVLECN